MTETQNETTAVATATAEAAGWDAAALAGKFLTFTLDDEHYGVQILKVREIIGLMQVTPVPGAPDCVRGVINLRGKIIPVMELRKRFGFDPIEDSDRSCIIVTEVEDDGQTIDMGLLVDAVSEVANFTAADIAAPPEFGAAVDTSFLLGIAKVGPEVKILLNAEKIVADGARELNSNSNETIPA